MTQKQLSPQYFTFEEGESKNWVGTQLSPLLRSPQSSAASVPLEGVSSLYGLECASSSCRIAGQGCVGSKVLLEGSSTHAIRPSQLILGPKTPVDEYLFELNGDGYVDLRPNLNGNFIAIVTSSPVSTFIDCSKRMYSKLNLRERLEFLRVQAMEPRVFEVVVGDSFDFRDRTLRGIKSRSMVIPSEVVRIVRTAYKNGNIVLTTPVTVSLAQIPNPYLLSGTLRFDSILFRRGEPNMLSVPANIARVAQVVDKHSSNIDAVIGDLPIALSELRVMIAKGTHLAAAVERLVPIAEGLGTNVPESVLRIGLAAQGVENVCHQTSNLLTSGLVKNNLVEVVCILLDIARELMQPHPMGCFTIAARIANYCACNIPECNRWVTEIWKFFHADTEKRDVVSARAGLPNTGGTVLAALFGITGMILTRKVVAVSTVNDIMARVKDVNTLIPGIKGLGAFFDWIEKHLPECVRAWTKYLFPEFGWKEDFERLGVEQWLAEVDDLCTDANKLILLHDSALQFNLARLKKTGREIVLALQYHSRESSGMYNHILRRATKVDEFTDIFKITVSMMENRRPVPFCLYLYGKPRIGKSVLTSALTEWLVPPELPERVRSYTAPVGSSFLDGYMCQYVCVLDDVAQDREGDDLLMIMKMINNIAFRPPMASLNDPTVGVKGTLFTSKIVICTSNDGYPHSNKLLNHEALHERRHVLVQVVVREDFQERVIHQMDPDEIACFEHLEFVIMHPSQKRELQRLNAEEFFLYVKEQRDNHEARMRKLMTGTQFGSFFKKLEAAEFRDAKPNVDVWSDEMIAILYSEHLTQEPWVKRFIIQSKNLGTWIIDGARSFITLCGELTSWCGERLRLLQIEHPTIFSIITEFKSLIPLIVFGARMFHDWWKKDESTRPNMANPSPTDDRLQEARHRRFMNRAQYREQEFDWEKGADYYGRQGVANVMSMRAIDEFDVSAHKLADVLQNNVGQISYNLGGIRYTICVFCPGGRIMLLPRHFLYPDGVQLPHGTTINIDFRDQEFQQSYREADVVEFPSATAVKRDLVALIGQPIMRQKRDYTKLLLEARDLEKVRRTGGYLISYLGKKERILELSDVCASSVVTEYAVGEDQYQLLDTLEYSALQNGPGYCGAVLVLANAKCPRKIAGIHVASSAGMGITEIVSAEEIVWLLKHKNVPAICEIVIPNFLEQRLSTMAPEGDFVHLGVMPKEHTTRVYDKTHLRHSVIFGRVFQPETDVAVMNPRDKRLDEDVYGQSIIKRAVEKYGKPSGPFDDDILDIGVDFLVQMFRSPERLRVLTEHEALNGIGGVTYLDALNMKSSPGFGFRCGKGKKHLFDNELPNLSIPPGRLRDCLRHREDAMLSGQRSLTIWTANLKDERLKFEKIHRGKTRAFSIAPVDHTILVRKYCLDFCRHFYSRHKDTFSAVGCDPEGGCWDIFMRKLLAVSDKLFDGDVANFDGTLAAQVMWAAMEVIQRTYDDGFRGVRRVLIEEMIHVVELMLEAVYIRSGGMSSGSALTVVINTLGSLLYYFYVYWTSAPATHRTFSKYLECVYMKVYGDDAIVSVAPSAVTFFNLRVVSEVLGSRGIVVTDSSKKATIENVTTGIDKVTFLKRSFGYSRDAFGGVCVPLIAKRTIQELTNWIHDNGDYLENTIVCCETALRFSVFYGRQYYEELLENILKAFDSTGHRVILPSYPEAVNFAREQMFGQIGVKVAP